jgi:hypothetical protein
MRPGEAVELRIPTGPCRLVVSSPFLTVPGAADAISLLWLDNLDVQASPPQPVVPVRMEAMTGNVAMITAAHAKLWLTNMDINGGGHAVRALDLVASQLDAEGGLAAATCRMFTWGLMLLLPCLQL